MKCSLSIPHHDVFSTWFWRLRSSALFAFRRTFFWPCRCTPLSQYLCRHARGVNGTCAPTAGNTYAIHARRLDIINHSVCNNIITTAVYSSKLVSRQQHCRIGTHNRGEKHANAETVTVVNRLYRYFPGCEKRDKQEVSTVNGCQTRTRKDIYNTVGDLNRHPIRSSHSDCISYSSHYSAPTDLGHLEGKGCNSTQTTAYFVFLSYLVWPRINQISSWWRWTNVIILLSALFCVFMACISVWLLN